MSSDLSSSVPTSGSIATDNMPREGHLSGEGSDMTYNDFLDMFTNHNSPEHQGPDNTFVFQPKNDLGSSNEQVPVEEASCSTYIPTIHGTYNQQEAQRVALDMTDLPQVILAITPYALQSLPDSHIAGVTSSAKGPYEPELPYARGKAGLLSRDNDLRDLMNLDPRLTDPNVAAAYIPPMEPFLPSPSHKSHNGFVSPSSNTSGVDTLIDGRFNDENSQGTNGSSEVQASVNSSVSPKNTRAKRQEPRVRDLINRHYLQKYRDPSFQVVFHAPITPLDILTLLVKGAWPCYMEDHPLPTCEAEVPTYLHKISQDKPEFDHAFQLRMAHETNRRLEKEEEAQRAFEAKAKRWGPKRAGRNSRGSRGRNGQVARRG